MVWTILIGIGSFLVIISLLPIRVQVRYSREGDHDHLEIRLRALFGLVRYRLEIPVLNLNLIMKRNNDLHLQIRTSRKRRPIITIAVEKIQNMFNMQQQLMERLHRYLPQIRRLTKVFHVERFQWYTVIGTGDAALTGTSVGIIWSIQSTMVGFMSHFFSFRTLPSLRVDPSFQQAGLRIQLNCIIRFRVGQAILAGTKFMIYLLREGKTSWQIIRSKV